LKIESDKIEKPNEVKDNSEIEKEKHHKSEFSQRESELEDELITLKIQLEEAKQTK
jgi:hypothetical protein